MENALPEINFRSIVPSIPNAASLAERIGRYLNQRESFVKRCPPWERCEWSGNELENLNVEAEHVDRVYYYHGFTINHCLFARMKYRNRLLYFSMTFGIKMHEGQPLVIHGKIYVTFDAHVFVKAIVHYHSKAKEICKMMKDDGIKVEAASLFDLHDQWIFHCNGVASLTLLCQLSIYENRNRHGPYDFTNILPVSIAKNLELFIKIRETVEDLDKANSSEEEDQS